MPLVPEVGVRATDANGDTLSGAKRYIYKAGTTETVPVFSDASLSTTQSNPLVADAGGNFEESYTAEGTYKLVVRNASGVVIFERDNQPVSTPLTSGIFSTNLEGIKTDGTDQTAALNTLFTTAAASGGEVLMAPGDYQVDGNLSVPANATVKFQSGAKLVFGTSATCSWNGNLVASPYQHIFSGTLVTGDYTRIGNTPYTFTVTGDPQLEWASPLWFGADRTGGVDASVEIYCALYWFKNCYIPRGTYKTGDGNTSGRIQIRQSGMRLWGDGPGQTIISKDNSTDDGGVIGLRGQPPSTSSGDPQEWVKGCIVRDLEVDGADATNTNGVGMSHARNNLIHNVTARNIGRKAFTLQYHCENNEFRACRVIDAAQEASSTHAAISLEGQESGRSYELDGGSTTTDDLEGVDMTGNVIDITSIEQSGFNYIVIQRGIANRINVETMGNCTGLGNHIVLSDYAKRNTVTFGEAGSTERRFIKCDASSERNIISGRRFGSAIGTNAEGYAIHDEGTANTFDSFSFNHTSQTATTQNASILVEGDEAVFRQIECRGTNQVSTVDVLSTANEVSFIDCRFEEGTTRVMRLQGPRALVRGGFFFAGTANVGIELKASHCTVIQATITGNTTKRVLNKDGFANNVIAFNHLTSGSSAQITFEDVEDLRTCAVFGNPGDRSGFDNIPLGARALWADATGDLRIGQDTITSDTGGTVVGSQS